MSLFFNTTQSSLQNAGKAWSYEEIKSATDDVLRFEVRPGDHWRDADGTKERSEISSSVKLDFGATYTLSYGLMIEPGARNSEDNVKIGQLHGTPDKNDSGDLGPVFAIQLDGERMKIVTRSDPNAVTPDRVDDHFIYTDSSDIQRGHWYDMKIIFKLDPQGQGQLDVWRDGVELVHYDGPLGYNDLVGPYWKEGIYRAAGDVTMAVDFKDTTLVEGDAGPLAGAPAAPPAPPPAADPPIVVPDQPATAATGGSAPAAEQSIVERNQILGTDAPDSLTGTAGDDALDGRGSDDVLHASAGHDLLSGSAGSDTAVFSGFAHGYLISANGGSGTVSGGAEGGVSVLDSIENLQFSDGVLTFDSASDAAKVTRLYDAFLGREPDSAGLDVSLRALASGSSLAQLADKMGGSAEFLAHTSALTDTQFVHYAFETALHREPDTMSLSADVSALGTGSLTRNSLVLQLAESPEHVALTASTVAAGLWEPNPVVEGLELLYDAALHRQPDSVGLQGYGGAIAAGETFRQIANQMASSTEFASVHAGQDNAAYVDSLYMSTLGRHAEAAGLDAYVGELDHGASRGDVFYSLAMSQEHQTHVLFSPEPSLVDG